MTVEDMLIDAECEELLMQAERFAAALNQAMANVHSSMDELMLEQIMLRAAVRIRRIKREIGL